ncbi:Crp/Fnr family transcriptional regulator [Chitinophaga deserti]|uniref:Crp/Fnr family transcriptional regulator n=1 Tax=Chitinophaga deserti TaxID=2164099 RepID=UPI000D6BF788|nr:Crp/Fnr family transcriptional regulator [Chitinophaga deserti]
MRRKPKRGKEIPFNYPFTQDYEREAFDGLYSGLRIYSSKLTEKVMLEVASYCSYHVYEKDAVVLDYGEVCEYVHFTLDGTVTALEKDEGKEHYCWFMTRGDVVIAIRSYLKQVSSKERLVALTKYTCISLHVNDLKMLSEKYPEVLLLDLKCTQHYYLQSFERTKWIRMSARKKYRMLKMYYPHLTKTENVTNKALASFLGICREHLTRIRKEFDK